MDQESDQTHLVIGFIADVGQDECARLRFVAGILALPGRDEACPKSKGCEQGEEYSTEHDVGHRCRQAWRRGYAADSVALQVGAVFYTLLPAAKDIGKSVTSSRSDFVVLRMQARRGPMIDTAAASNSRAH